MNRDEKVVALPGVTPCTLINHDAAEQLQEIVDQLKRGEVVGVAWVTVNADGFQRTGSHAPNKLADSLFSGIHWLAHRILTGQ